MKDQKEYRTGTITSNNQNYAFYSEGFKFVFMDSRPNSNNSNTLFPSKDGFIYGQLHDRRDIGIYVGKKQEFPIHSHRRLITGAYYVCNHQWHPAENTEIFGVEFRGGTLNTLLDRSKKSCNFAEKERIVVDDPDIKHTFSVRYGQEEWQVIVGADSRWSYGVSGVHVNDSGVYLRVLFPRGKTEDEVFKVHTAIMEMLSFLTFRRNVGFDELHFLNTPDEQGLSHPCAQVYVRNEETFTGKSYYQCITFDDLGDRLPLLIELMLRDADDKASYMLGFLPENDKEASRMSSTRLREICSAIECELFFVNDLKKEEDKRLNELITNVKSLIKSHRKSPNPLSNKTYDVIYSSIEHWSLATADKIFLLYQRYEDIINAMNHSSYTIDAVAIDKFVKFRNQVTHGKYRIIDEAIGMTAFTLQGLVYCCILTRIGISYDRLRTLFNQKRILD